ncbi:MAG: SoxR reducing system RseC family protein [Alkalispirochaetaceae bacterium]
MQYAPSDDGRVIYHEGVAEEVQERTALVRFVQNGACGSCQLQSVCNPAEQRVRTVLACHDGSLHPGDRVRLGVEESVAWLSILFSFVLPFFVVAISFFTIYFRTGNDIAAGAAALGILPAYYLLVYQFRERLAGKVRFTALPTKESTPTPMRGIS